MVKATFQCPLNMGLSYPAQVQCPASQLKLHGGIVVPVALKVSNTALPGSPTLDVVIQANHRTNDGVVYLPPDMSDLNGGEDYFTNANANANANARNGGDEINANVNASGSVESKEEAAKKKKAQRRKLKAAKNKYSNSQEFYWVGVTTKKVQLPPGGVLTVHFQVFMPQPKMPKMPKMHAERACTLACLLEPYVFCLPCPLIFLLHVFVSHCDLIFNLNCTS